LTGNGKASQASFHLPTVKLGVVGLQHFGVRAEPGSEPEVESVVSASTAAPWWRAHFRARCQAHALRRGLFGRNRTLTLLHGCFVSLWWRQLFLIERPLGRGLRFR